MLLYEQNDMEQTSRKISRFIFHLNFKYCLYANSHIRNLTKVVLNYYNFDLNHELTVQGDKKDKLQVGLH